MSLRLLIILALLPVATLNCAPAVEPAKPAPTVTVTATPPPITVTVTSPPPPPITVTVAATPSPTAEPYYMHSLIIDAEGIVRAIQKFGNIYAQAYIPRDKTYWAPAIVRIRVQAETIAALLKQYEAGGLDKDKAKVEITKLKDTLAELMQLTYEGEKNDSQNEQQYWSRRYVIERYRDYRTYIEPMITEVNRILEKLPIVQPG